jgi:hypothetical protein
MLQSVPIRTALYLALVGFVSNAWSDGPLFEKDIRPILREHCYDCHGAEKELKGELDLRLRRFMVQGGKSGPAIVPGDPSASLLIERIRGGEMPPSGKAVPAEQIAIIENWIAAKAPTARPEPASIGSGLGVTKEERDYWAFQPIRRPSIPAYEKEDRARTPIDGLLLQRLKGKGGTFSPDASKSSLIRRAYFGLIGLPPSADAVRKFSANKSATAYEQLIDELLKSEHYGERWGRHWLDVAGYADSEGVTQKDTVRPHAWRYRDYVIRSLNSDKPFDRFIVEQLAGDELVPPPHAYLSPDKIELLTATGFLRMAADGTDGGGNTQMGRNQVVTDTLKIVASSLLGLSVGCAECHDHRYDPVSQKDYYQFRAIFEPAFMGGGWRTPGRRKVSLYTAADRKKANEIKLEADIVIKARAKKRIEFVKAAFEVELKNYPMALQVSLRDAYETPAAKRSAAQKKLLTDNPAANVSLGSLYQFNPKAAEELKKFDAQIKAVLAKQPKEEFVRVMNETPGKIPVTKIFHRGDPRQPTDEVGPAALTIASPPDQQREFVSDDPHVLTTGRRLAYARWLTSGRHPLTARVIVNRVWQQHFGRGLVATPDEFGVLGEAPSHPELLDWLADEFMSSGWSLKQLHRTIMTSTVYRQASKLDSDRAGVDPDNQLYWRKPVIRLDAELVRDGMLSASGALDPTLFGPPIEVKEDGEGQVIEAVEPTRRSLYVQVRRSQPLSMLTVFDAPVMEVNCAQRPSSTVAPQSLLMMNSEFVLKQAEKMADRVLKESPLNPLPKSKFDFARLAAVMRGGWEFGYGTYDPKVKRTKDFAVLPYKDKTYWKGGTNMPDPKLGWVWLGKFGGHPGKFAAVRRWTSPGTGKVSVTGLINHPSTNGNGVIGRIISSREGLHGEWTLKTSEAKTELKDLNVQAGDTVDFLVDPAGSVTSDGFGWKMTITLVPESGKPTVWDSVKGFYSADSFKSLTPDTLPARVARAWELAYGRGPRGAELDSALAFISRQLQHLSANPVDKREPIRLAMANLCQSLLNSNEFLYID